jgi:hypothetical protein
MADRLLAVIYLSQIFTEERLNILKCYFGVQTNEDERWPVAYLEVARNGLRI